LFYLVSGHTCRNYYGLSESHVTLDTRFKRGAVELANSEYVYKTYNAIGVSLAKSKIVSLGFKRKKFHQLQNRRLQTLTLQ